MTKLEIRAPLNYEFNKTDKGKTTFASLENGSLFTMPLMTSFYLKTSSNSLFDLETCDVHTVDLEDVDIINVFEISKALLYLDP